MQSKYEVTGPSLAIYEKSGNLLLNCKRALSNFSLLN